MRITILISKLRDSALCTNQKQKPPTLNEDLSMMLIDPNLDDRLRLKSAILQG